MYATFALMTRFHANASTGSAIDGAMTLKARIPHTGYNARLCSTAVNTLRLVLAWQRYGPPMLRNHSQWVAKGIASGAASGGTPEMTKSDYKLEHKSITAEEAAAMTSDLTKQKAPLVGFHVAGECPSCKHPTSDLFSLVAVVEAGSQIQLAAPPMKDAILAGPRGATTKTVDKIRVAAMHCRCAGDHAGASGAFGCGTSWLLGTTSDIDPKKVSSTEPTFVALTLAEETKWWPAAEGVASASTSALTVVQAVGTKWQAGIASILAVAGLATITGARDTLHKINGYSEFFILALGVLAILLTAISLALALWSTVGFPALGDASSTQTLEGADLEPLRQAFESVKWLKRSSWCSLAAFVASFAAILILLITPDSPTPPAASTAASMSAVTRSAPGSTPFALIIGRIRSDQ